MLRSSRTVFVAAAGLLMVACGGSPSASSSPTPTTPATASAPQQSASPVALDPCQLVTSSEASALAGASFAAGKEGTTSDGGGKTCAYGAQTANVFMVLVTQAPDAATAQADWAQEQARAQEALQQGVPAGLNVSLNVSDISGVAGADRAAIASFNTTISGQAVGVIAIYVLKGRIFFTFSDLVVGHATPTASAMEAQAHTVLGRLP